MNCSKNKMKQYNYTFVLDIHTSPYHMYRVISPTAINNKLSDMTKLAVLVFLEGEREASGMAVVEFICDKLNFLLSSVQYTRSSAFIYRYNYSI